MEKDKLTNQNKYDTLEIKDIEQKKQSPDRKRYFAMSL